MTKQFMVSKILKALPLGIGVPMIAVAASNGPDDVGRNLAKWPAALGWNEAAHWVAEYLTGPKVFWGTIIFCAVYVLVVWGLPALLRHTKTATAAITIPIIVAFIFIGSLFAGYHLAQPNVWHFTDDQKKILTAAMAKEPQKLNFGVIPVPASPSAIAYSYSLLKFMGWENGWGVQVLPYDAYYSPEDVGLKIAVKKGTDPETNENAQTLKRVFEALGPKIPFVGDPRLADNGVALIVGARP
jgi:hypothetical protein